MLSKSEYSQHLFYDRDRLSLKKKKEIINWAIERSYEWWVDKLDCSESFSRQKIDMSLDEIISKLDKKCHFVIIHRRGFAPRSPDDKYRRWYLEVGFTTMTPISYYLWIKCDESFVPKIIEEFDLKLKN
jgi:hypothetical protein